MSTDFMSRPAVLLLALTALAVIFLPAREGSLRRLPARGSGTTAEFIVGLAPALSGLTQGDLSARLGVPVVSRSMELAAAVVSLPDEAAMERLLTVEGVISAERNEPLSAASAPNDPLYTLQAPYFDQMGTTGVWPGNGSNRSVVVAVIDSGIDAGHPDLEGVLWVNDGEEPDNGIDDDANGCVDDVHGCAFFNSGAVTRECASLVHKGDIGDDYGHGTFVAGIIAAQADNEAGIAGIAPGVTVMPVKILDCAGGGSVFDAAQAVLYAARNGARVANLSFGLDSDSPVLTAAIREAYYGYGMLVVAATGSTGEASVQFPARMPEVIAVGSSGSASGPEGRSSFSNWGPEVTVAAPGYGVVSTAAEGLCPEAWLCLEEPYAVASGTSFAAPMVTALAALLLSEKPDLPPDLVRGVIQATAYDLPDEGEMLWDGAGRIRILEAMQFARYYLAAD